jgi:hypothetical protein
MSLFVGTHRVAAPSTLAVMFGFVVSIDNRLRKHMFLGTAGGRRNRLQGDLCRQE